MSEFVVFYDVLNDMDLRTTYAFCVDERDLERRMKYITNHGFQNVSVFQSVDTPPTNKDEL